MRRKIYELVEITDNGNGGRKVYDLYDILMLVFIIISLIPLCFKESNGFFTFLEYASVVVFGADYILRWITADLKLGGKGITPFVRYPFSFFAILDLLSLLPALSVIYPGFGVLRLFRLGKAFRALRLLRYSNSFQMILAVIRRERRPLTAVCALAGGYIFLSALILFQVEPDSFDTFFDAIYWSVVTLTTVGYGDIYPISDTGRIVSMLSSLMGIAIVALPTGIISAGYINELSRAERKARSESCEEEQNNEDYRIHFFRRR